MLDLAAKLHALRGFAAFPSVRDINARLLGLHARSSLPTGVEVIGTSRGGHPIHMLSLGHGTRHALVVAMPHPNEPIGALAQHRLAELLMNDPHLLAELGLVWHFIGCADPDGALLNQGWFAGPYDGTTYARHVHRPPFEEQFEWTFHRPELDEPGLPPLPESTAVARVIDTLRPELLISMHNAESGGLYAYVTEPTPHLSAVMTTVRDASGVALDLGEPEEAGEALSPALIHAPANTTGAPMLCSTDYAAQYGTFGLMVEPPLWADPRAEDTRTVGATRDELRGRYLARRLDLGKRLVQWRDVLAPVISLDTARGRALSTLTDAAAAEARWPAPATGRASPATVAFAASLSNALDLERLRGAGQALSLLAENQALTPGLVEVRADAEACLTQWARTATSTRATFVGLSTALAGPVGLSLGLADAISKH